MFVHHIPAAVVNLWTLIALYVPFTFLSVQPHRSILSAKMFWRRNLGKPWITSRSTLKSDRGTQLVNPDSPSVPPKYSPSVRLQDSPQCPPNIPLTTLVSAILSCVLFQLELTALFPEWSEMVWLKTGTGGGMLWTQSWIFGFCRTWRIT